jgi:hypothetical protein
MEKFQPVLLHSRPTFSKGIFCLKGLPMSLAFGRKPNIACNPPSLISHPWSLLASTSLYTPPTHRSILAHLLCSRPSNSAYAGFSLTVLQFSKFSSSQTIRRGPLSLLFLSISMPLYGISVAVTTPLTSHGISAVSTTFSPDSVCGRHRASIPSCGHL